MDGLLGVALLALGSALALWILHVSARFEHRIEGAALVVRRRILGRFPLDARRIALADIAEVRRTQGLVDLWRGGELYGSFALSTQGVVIVRRRRWLARRFLVTPPDPDRFVAMVRAAVSKGAAAERGEVSGGGSPSVRSES